MAIQYVGGVTASRSGSNSTTAQSLTSLTGGIASAPASGDLIVVTCVVGSQGRNADQAIGGYTTIGTQLNPTATQDTSLQVSYKFADITPDTSVTIPSTGNNQDAQCWSVQVFRGVNQDTPLDVAAVSATGTGTSRPDPASITPSTAGSWIVCCTGGSAAATTAYTFSGLSNVLTSVGSDTNDSAVGSGYKSDWSSGVYDQAASSTGSANAADSWASWTIALRPTAAFSTLTENFNAALDTTNKWNIESSLGGSVTVSGGIVDLIPGGTANSTAGVNNKERLNLEGSECYLQVIRPVQTASGEDAFQFFEILDANGSGNSLLWLISSAGNLTARVTNAGTPDDADVVVGTWSNTNHKWLKISLSGGTATWWTAPDSGSGTPGTWTSQRTDSTLPSTFTDVKISLWSIWYGPNSITQTGQFDGLNTAGTGSSQQITSVADSASYSTTAAAAKDSFETGASPATYSYSGAAATAGINRVSVANPATYAATPAAGRDHLTDFSSPATYTYAGAAAVSSAGRLSIATPAAYAFTGVDATSSVTTADVGSSAADPATYSMTGAATTNIVARVSIALPAAYLTSGVATKSGKNTVSIASPAGYSLIGAATVSGLAKFSTALPATYAMAGAVATAGRSFTSDAIPATYLLVPAVTTDSTTGIEGGSTIPVTVNDNAKAPLTDDEFITWLKETEDAYRVILVECQCIDNNGNVNRLFFANRAYVSGPFDSISNQVYEPWIRGGLDFRAQLSLDLNSGSQSYGDIELDNTEGDLDWALEQSWQYQPVQAFIGDARWPRQDFRKIFDGTCEDIDSSDRGLLNLRLRDKLYRLEMPIHDTKIGGTSAERDSLLPVAFGECHNVTPVLTDAATLSYCFHARMAEDVFEVRDNGIPVSRVYSTASNPATFKLTNQPAGRVTCSVQGDRTVLEGYQYSVVGIVYRILTQWGTEPNKRFVDTDFDLDSLYQFSQNNSQPVGVYFTDRITVLEAAQRVASSIGARLVMDSRGKLSMTKVDVPPDGTPIAIGASDMVADSLSVSGRPTLRPSVKLGFAKNWTVQPDTASGLPEEHKKLFAQEWLTTTAVNEDARTKYELWGEPEQENTFLLIRDDAVLEASRRLSLRSVQRHVYEFTGFADLIFTPLGAPAHLSHPRFGLSGPGKIGQVISVSVDWIHARVTLEVLA